MRSLLIRNVDKTYIPTAYSFQYISSGSVPPSEVSQDGSQLPPEGFVHHLCRVFSKAVSFIAFFLQLRRIIKHHPKKVKPKIKRQAANA
jgi:hypothetical protein